MLPQPDLNHDLRNKLWAALEAIKLFLTKTEKNNFSLIFKAKIALEQSLALLEGQTPDLPGDLGDMLCGSLTDLFPLARNKGISLKVFPTKSIIPAQIDKFVFLRIAHNLVINAIEAAESRVIVQSGYWTDDYGNSLFPAVSVQDDGNGIPAEKLPHIFSPGASSKGSKRGHGLHIVKTLLKTTGTLTLFTSDHGTTFHVIFGYRREDNHA